VTGVRLAVPPGRAGRLWLDRRLGAARRGADLLDRKLRILSAELVTRSAAAERAGQDWRRLAAEADQALLVAALLGGQRAIRLAAGDGGAARVRIGYAVTIGVRHPAQARVTPPPGPPPWASQPVEQARLAHRAALDAAVRCAVAARAAAVIEAETVTTRYRLRAIRDRLIPSLEQARAEVLLAIDEQERSDGARLRRVRANVADRMNVEIRAGPGPPGPPR